MINLHAPAAPSSANEWRWCAGSIPLSQGMADEETDDQREGTATHWVCERTLDSFIDPDAPIIVSTDLIGQQAPNGVVINEEMWDAAQVYVSDILLTANQHGLLQQIHIEEAVVMPEIHELCWGTPDLWMFDPVTMTLYLYDFKYGHYSVVAFENWQMICYILGILRVITGGNPLQDYHITVKVRIVQPRCYHDGLGPFRDWTIPAVDLRAHVNILNAAAHAAFSETPGCISGTWCKHCDGAVRCKAIAGAVANAIDHSSDAVPLNMDEMGLGFELDKINRAEALLKTRRAVLETDAEHRIRHGSIIPGWGMEQRYGNDAWLGDDAAVIATGSLMGVDFRAPSKVLTPSQAKTLMKRSNVDPMAIEGTYGKSPSSMKLVVDDGSKARMIFKN